MAMFLAADILNNHVLVICATIALICIVSEIGCYAMRWRKADLDAELKHEMLARGMSAEEIAQVLAAGSSSRRRRMESLGQATEYADTPNS